MPGDPRYETAFARVQVGGAAQLKLVQVSADPVVVRLMDANGLPYPGARIAASVSDGGSVSPSSARRMPRGSPHLFGRPAPARRTNYGSASNSFPRCRSPCERAWPCRRFEAVVNAASFSIPVRPRARWRPSSARISPGARVLLNGAPLAVLYGSRHADQFLLLPAEIRRSARAVLTVTAPSGEQAPQTINVTATQPGIFTAF